MAAHIKKRKDRGSVWYLVDGAKIRSLNTTKKGVAEQLLKKYIQGKHNVDPLPTIEQFYNRWIKTKTPPLFRTAQHRDYQLHFTSTYSPSGPTAKGGPGSWAACAWTPYRPAIW
jgi:hypothetical protein